MRFEDKPFNDRLRTRKTYASLSDAADAARRIMYEARKHQAVVATVYDMVAHASYTEQQPFRDDAYWPMLALELLRRNVQLMDHLLDVANSQPNLIFNLKEPS